jgi:hypothetical protein
MGQFPQLAIDERHRSVESRCVAVSPGAQQVCDFMSVSHIPQIQDFRAARL